MSKNSISIDLDDPRTGIVAEALSNKTCVKILSLLAENELTASDVAARLHIPLNTTGYNIEKLMQAGLVEKSSSYFWSVKGKKTPVYKVSNKKIVISPKRVTRGVVPAVLTTFLISLGIKSYTDSNSMQTMQGTVSDSIAASAPEYAIRATEAAGTVMAESSGIFTYANSWLWFLVGSLTAILIIVVTKAIIERRS